MNKAKKQQEIVIEIEDNLYKISRDLDMTTAVQNLTHVITYMLNRNHDTDLLRYFFNEVVNRFEKSKKD